jgi:hypothetical protein
VQRQAEEEEPIQAAPEAAAPVLRQAEEEEEEEEIQAAPDTALPTLPLAQRQAEAVGEEPIQAAPEAAAPVLRQAEEEEERPIQTAPEAVQRLRTAEPDESPLLARVSSRAQLPLNKRPESRERDAMPRSMPVQRTAILPQARLAREPADAGARGPEQDLPVPGGARMAPRPGRTTDRGMVTAQRKQAIRSDLPLPPVISAQRAERVQRQAATPVTDGSSVVQRAAMLRAPPSQEEAAELSEQDLEKLAQDIYPIIRRRLAIERERRIGRW